MPSGFKVGGVDLDSIFKARAGGDPSASATGYKVGGADLNGRYYPSQGTHDRIAGNTGYKVGGADLRTIFRDIAYVGDPIITDHPDGAIKRVGQSVTFSVAATGTGALSYQWQKNGVNIGGATGTSYTINPIALADAGNYRCVVTGIETVPSNAAALNIAPSITNHPDDITENSGVGARALVCEATGEGTLQFEWFKDGVSIAGPRNGNISGTSDQHVINPGATADNGEYVCKVTNAYGEADSNAATVTYTNVPPAVTDDPDGFAGVDGNGPYALQCYASQGSGASLQFEWFKDGVSFLGPRAGNLSGGLGDQHVFNPIGFGDAGDYVCRVSTTHGTDDSAAATVTVS